MQSTSVPYNLFVGCLDFWEVSCVFGKNLSIFEHLLLVFSSVVLHIGQGHYQKPCSAPASHRALLMVMPLTEGLTYPSEL